jgi:hypothetical protein
LRRERLFDYKLASSQGIGGWGSSDPVHSAPVVFEEGLSVKHHEILAEFTRILNRFGPDSPEEEAFLREHRDNQELVELAGLASTLKRALKKVGQPPEVVTQSPPLKAAGPKI